MAESEEVSLTEQFYRARRQLVLFAGLLLAWELIGIEIDPCKPIYGNIVLKSPQAAPWVFLALITYFSLRTAIEWFKSRPQTRNHWASKLDVLLSYFVVILAISIYSYQAASGSQIANVVGGLEVINFVAMPVFFIGALRGLSLYLELRMLRKRKEPVNSFETGLRMMKLYLSLSAISILPMAVSVYKLGILSLLAPLAITLILASLFGILFLLRLYRWNSTALSL